MPLSGLLVADFSRVLAGPLCAQTLGDLGADVVKVERPDGGDDTRGWGPPRAPDGTATYYLALNRNKRSLRLDLKDPGDRALARELALRADVVVESFRPGLMDGLGLGFDDLVAAGNPGVTYCSISAFGGAALPGYDLLLQAMGGLMSVTGEEGGRPLKVGAPVVDVLCGLWATIGVLAALRDGGGRRVEVSLMDSALTGLLNQASGWLNGGVVPGPMGNRHPSLTPYETFGDLVVACGNDAMFARLCDAVGAPEVAQDPRFATNAARLEHRDALVATLEPLLAGDEVEVRLRAAGVPVGRVNDVPAAFALAEELGLAPVDETGGVRTVRSPLADAGVRLPPPGLGEHDDELRAWLTRPHAAPPSAAP
ncbi:CaiB/BaiF CoA-transferase family protein [Conexibacter sp. SYSU D00693]|uniref:CaiB/BaiF CoA transferase family protein n=1 Tax=Conexibacter sp. SYSU D00693 TaxID=2812560 RepID=UPI00196AB68E|nr:CoA transferase [Conexibacter sp. SYSU D00693]